MQLNGEQRKHFQDALMNAFPNVTDLKQMISFGLNENLEAIAMGGNNAEIVFNLIKWAEAQGKTEELLNAAYNKNSGNPLLSDFRQQISEAQSQVLTIQPQAKQQEAKKNSYEQSSDDGTKILSQQEEDYKQLEDYLKAKKFQEADQETKNILLLSLGKTSEEKIGVEEIRSLLPEILLKIDELWMRYSNEKFGFTTQISIWQNLLSPQKGFFNRFFNQLFKKNKFNNNDKDNWYKFAKDIGWYHTNPKTARKEWIQYTNLNFTLDAPKGHFPYFRSWWKGMRYQYESGRCIALMEQIKKITK